MSPDDDWQPPPCKHGVKPITWTEQVEIDFGTYRYDCPTPDQCKWEIWQQATKQ